MAFSTMGTAGGALGGAATGASIGSVVPGVGTAIGAGVGALIGGLGGSGLFGGKSSTPSFNPQQSLQFAQQAYNQMAPNALNYAAQLYAQAANEGIDFAKRGTAANVSNQEVVTPGSSAQREAALNQLNSYMQGQVPQDVQQQINRQVAQNLGGGFNLFNGGGQAPQNFARNLGQTSLGLSQYGLSAAPTWQQLANQMVVSPSVGLEAGLQAGQQGLSLTNAATSAGLNLGESAYQGAFNQYQGQQLQNQYQNQLGLGLGNLGTDLYKANTMSNYYSNLTPSAQGRLNTLGGLPATQNLDSLSSYYGNPVAGYVGRPGTSSFSNFMTTGGWD